MRFSGAVSRSHDPDGISSSDVRFQRPGNV